MSLCTPLLISSSSTWLPQSVRLSLQRDTGPALSGVVKLNTKHINNNYRFTSGPSCSPVFQLTWSFCYQNIWSLPSPQTLCWCVAFHRPLVSCSGTSEMIHAFYKTSSKQGFFFFFTLIDCPHIKTTLDC